ncbi:hypothetical protein GOODEAATRI_007278 [Goodea atripinnis]|uniref:Uncharacterized protein n=1 Tax=Goodea atripinnis TaxID=208336 RepID=A0ABV0PC49_9TELE
MEVRDMVGYFRCPKRHHQRALYMKLRCDDQPMLEHAEQLLGELGGEMEAEDEDPDLDDDYEPCSDDEEGGETEAPMEH